MKESSEQVTRLSEGVEGNATTIANDACTSTQGESSPQVTHNPGEVVTLGGLDASKVQDIPDKGALQSPGGNRGDDSSANDPENLHVADMHVDKAAGNAGEVVGNNGEAVENAGEAVENAGEAVENAGEAVENAGEAAETVLGCGNMDKGCKITAVAVPGSEKGSGSNTNLRNKPNTSSHEHAVKMPRSRNTFARLSNSVSLLRNKPKDVAAYMKKAGKIFKVKTEDLKEDDVIIAIMGPTGAGKSSFINVATGNDEGVGHDLESCTNSIDILKFQYIERSMQDVIFVDTPGFDDTHKSDIEILDMIASWLKKTYEQNIKLAGILYFHRITDNRMAGTPLKNLHMFEKLCGKDALQNIILTTTMWDEVDEATGVQREKELERHYWKTMITQGSRTMRYHNTEESAWEIIDNIVVDHNERYAVELQRELVDLEKELPETGAGRELFHNLQTLVKRQQDTLHRLRDSMKRHDDEAILNALKDEYEELRKQTEATVKEMEVLRITIGKRLRRLFTSTLGFFRLSKK